MRYLLAQHAVWRCVREILTLLLYEGGVLTSETASITRCPRRPAPQDVWSAQAARSDIQLHNHTTQRLLAESAILNAYDACVETQLTSLTSFAAAGELHRTLEVCLRRLSHAFELGKSLQIEILSMLSNHHMSTESSDDLPLNARGLSPTPSGSGSPVPEWLSAHKVHIACLPHPPVTLHMHA